MHSPIKTKQLTMDFPTAIKEVTEGRRVTKLEWGDSRVYGILRDGFLMLHKSDGRFYQWIISDGDLLGADWVIALDN